MEHSGDTGGTGSLGGVCDGGDILGIGSGIGIGIGISSIVFIIFCELHVSETLRADRKNSCDKYVYKLNCS